MKSAICLSVKNEVHDIAEWVAHYTRIGADQIIVYNDGSDDGTLELLNKLSDHFPLRIIDWKTEARNRQVAAYADCLKRFGDEFEWIGFLDGDEFLIPPPGASLPDLLERHKDHDAFAINWLVFGTAGIASMNGRLVLETFTRRAVSTFGPNHHVKSFVRPAKVEGVINAHCFKVPVLYDVMGNGPIEWRIEGVVKEGTHVEGDWRLHHYVTRSDEHCARRLERGRANDAKPRDPNFIRDHDRNEVHDERGLLSGQEVRALLQSKGLLAAGVPAEPTLREPPKATALAPPQPSVAHNIHLHIDELTHERIRGWALDASRHSVTPLELRFLVDGVLQEQVVCDRLRPDLQKVGYQANSGFDFTLPRSVFDGSDHILTVKTTDNIDVVISMGREKFLKKVVNEKWRPKFLSNLDGVHEGVLKGWVLRQSEDGKMVGDSMLAVYCESSLVGHVRANRLRIDVGMIHASDPKCGFEFLIPPEFHNTRQQKFSVRAVPYNVELHGSPLTTSFLAGSQQAMLADVLGAVDQMYREITGLRYKLRSMVPQRKFTLGDYNEWARRYQEALDRRFLKSTRRRTKPQSNARKKGVGVSIVCPTYKPNLRDFVQAVESVISQRYQDWELILIDDGSEMPDLTAQMDAFAKRDTRIKVVKQEQNSGIANATNKGLEVASGKYVAFFDHDDLLVDVALEVMVKQAKASKALLLYSDEDKIDSGGYFSQPAFKPDWNHRMMLSANYLGHLVMVDRASLMQVGPLSQAHNGAQDHDLLLRLAELIPPDRIRHVPEILYHWRISETSTAGNIAAKPYAVKAGELAITDHLRRRGLKADVESIAHTTWYKVNWKFTQEPSACIIIPFKDEIDVTGECLQRIIGGTDYKNFEVILVDNWSTSEEALRFTERAREDSRVRVMRIEEPFNYSRLNNLAAAKTDATYLVLMNNDLHVRNPNWLRVMVNEAMADKYVGVVGGKFLYPNGSLQHGGVVTGIGGVACHLHCGIGEDDPGYEGRALFAQELSAVTGACMLIDRKLYWRLDGLDERHLKVAFNDVDLCLKARKAGYKVIWTPEFVATHHESLSRGADLLPHKEGRFFDEWQYMVRKWGKSLTQDPFYSRFFDLNAHTPCWGLINPDKSVSRPLPWTPHIDAEALHA